MLGMNRQQQEAAFALKLREEARVREASAAKTRIKAKARKAATDAEFKRGGDGWQSRMNDARRKAAHLGKALKSG